jgi:hypothetical protein
MSATVLCEKPAQTQQEQLGQLLARAHEDVQAHGVADCPICGGTLAAWGADARCDDCGARLF